MFRIIIRKLPYVYTKTSVSFVNIFRAKSLHFNNSGSPSLTLPQMGRERLTEEKNKWIYFALFSLNRIFDYRPR